MGFLSQDAAQSLQGAKAPYTLAEDKLICAGLEEGQTAAEIAEILVAEGHARTVASVRYRTNILRDASEEFESLEAFHADGE